MKITIKYFAHLKEQTLGKEQEICEISNNTDIKTLYQNKAKEYNFTIPYESILIAVNKKIITHNIILQDNDEVAFLPPASGG